MLNGSQACYLSFHVQQQAFATVCSLLAMLPEDDYSINWIAGLNSVNKFISEVSITIIFNILV